MTDATGAEDEKALSDLVELSFPDIRCLRCGNPDFYLLRERDSHKANIYHSHNIHRGDPDPRLSLVTLVCVRCGMLEQHAAAALRNAEKPIVVTRTGESN